MKNYLKKLSSKVPVLQLFLGTLTLLLLFSLPLLSVKMSSSGYNGKFIDQESPAFELKDLKGDQVNESILLGKWTLLTFGFSKCTEICPLNLGKLSNLIDKLEESSSDVLDDTQFIFISIDKERDSVKSMTEFISNFSPKVQPLISGNSLGANVARKFKTFVQQKEKGQNKDENYQINHSGFFYLIDPQAKIKLLYIDKEIELSSILEDLNRMKS